jgi:Uma2 family endonuclease
MAACQSEETSLLDGPPLLAVEILSPSDRQEEIDEKVEEYLAAGVALVWVVNPRLRAVTVFRGDAEPEMFNVRQDLSAGPHLPGFRVAVEDLFQ